MQLTFNQFLGKLSSEERTQYFVNISFDRMRDISKTKDSYHDRWLSSAFSWEETPQGWEYWKNINKRVFTKIPSTPVEYKLDVSKITFDNLQTVFDVLGITLRTSTPTESQQKLINDGVFTPIK